MTAKYPDVTPRAEVIALFAGSFDPFTIGHLSIVERSLPLVDRLVIVVGVNESKLHATPASERINAINRAIAPLPGASRIEVTQWNGLTAELARRLGARYLIRGARTAADFDFEYTLAAVNRDVAGIETIIFPALPEHAAVSSSIVRELQHFGHDASKYLP